MTLKAPPLGLWSYVKKGENVHNTYKNEWNYDKKMMKINKKGNKNM